jgi:hypothetical protein
MWQIEDLLRRRTDLSTFVIHWTRQWDDGQSALENLGSILDEGILLARTPLGAALKPLKRLKGEGLAAKEYRAALDSQQVVCFTEAPLEQAWSFVCPISGRRAPLDPLGSRSPNKRREN